MRVAHVSLSVEYYPGVARQRADEAVAARLLDGDAWDVFVVSGQEGYGRDGVRRIAPDVPGWLTGLFPPGRGGVGRIGMAGRALTLNLAPARGAFNRVVDALAGEYDVVLARYYPGEIWARPMRRRENVLFVHHTLAVRELGLESRMGALIERVTGPRRQRGCLGVVGVTPEIARAEALRAGGLAWLSMPNAIHAQRVRLAGDVRGDALRLVMVAGRFRPWHGLDVVLARMAEYAGHEPFELHLAGALDADLRRLVIGTPRVAWHGILEPAPLDALLSTADVCFGSMAMHRAGLAEASSIKVRDALARGLPVVAGCADPAFPADFPWYMPLERDWAWGEALERARRARGASRAEVAAAAREHIDYLPVMRRFLADLRGLVP